MYAFSFATHDANFVALYFTRKHLCLRGCVNYCWPFRLGWTQIDLVTHTHTHTHTRTHTYTYTHTHIHFKNEKRVPAIKLEAHCIQVFELLASVPWLDEDDVDQKQLKGVATVCMFHLCFVMQSAWFKAVSCAAASSLLKLSEEWYLGKAQGQCINIYIYIYMYICVNFVLCCEGHDIRQWI